MGKVVGHVGLLKTRKPGATAGRWSMDTVVSWSEAEVRHNSLSLGVVA